MSGFYRGPLRLYYERRAKTYLLVDHSFDGAQEALLQGQNNGYEAIGEILQDNDPQKPCLGSTSVSWQHIHSKCTRVSWAQVPDIWQKALSAWIEPGPHRSLWRTCELKIACTPKEDLPLLIGSVTGPALKLLERRLRDESEFLTMGLPCNSKTSK